MKLIWKVVGVSIGATLLTNTAINTVSKIRRSRMEDEDYQLELEAKREAKRIKKQKKLEKKEQA